MRYFWLLPVLVGGTGMLLLPRVLSVCFLIPLLLGTVLTVLAGRFRLAAAWVGLAGLSVMAFISGWVASRSPNMDDELGLPIVGAAYCVVFYLFLFIGLIMPGLVKDRSTPAP